MSAGKTRNANQPTLRRFGPKTKLPNCSDPVGGRPAVQFLGPQQDPAVIYRPNLCVSLVDKVNSRQSRISRTSEQTDHGQVARILCTQLNTLHLVSPLLCCLAPSDRKKSSRNQPLQTPPQRRPLPPEPHSSMPPNPHSTTSTTRPGAPRWKLLLPTKAHASESRQRASNYGSILCDERKCDTIHMKRTRGAWDLGFAIDGAVRHLG
jgi:hypothetical protein